MMGWTKPNAWLCEEPIHSVVAEVWTHLCHLRGVANRPRPPRLGSAPGRGLAARAPWVRTRAVSQHDLPHTISRAYMHVFSYVACVCIPCLQLMGHGLMARPFLGGWRLARGLVSPPFATGTWCICACFGLIHSNTMYCIAPQPRSAQFDAWMYFYSNAQGINCWLGQDLRGPGRGCRGWAPPFAHILMGKVGAVISWFFFAFR
jgi:hypothetical protein